MLFTGAVVFLSLATDPKTELSVDLRCAVLDVRDPGLRACDFRAFDLK